MNIVQNCDSYINIPSSKSFRPYEYDCCFHSPHIKKAALYEYCALNAYVLRILLSKFVLSSQPITLLFKNLSPPPFSWLFVYRIARQKKNLVTFSYSANRRAISFSRRILLANYVCLYSPRGSTEAKQGESTFIFEIILFLAETSATSCRTPRKNGTLVALETKWKQY
jgi:hypothetical protein